MATAPSERERRIRAILEDAERVHGEYMRKYNELKRRQIKLIEAVIEGAAKEKAKKILSALKGGE